MFIVQCLQSKKVFEVHVNSFDNTYNIHNHVQKYIENSLQCDWKHLIWHLDYAHNSLTGLSS